MITSPTEKDYRFSLIQFFTKLAMDRVFRVIPWQFTGVCRKGFPRVIGATFGSLMARSLPPAMSQMQGM
ncbi:hypothetical protein BJP05_02995 [Corynebacterium sp. NML98-0116]|nr:hypothetical protein BJP05_02995 [Corynebacterium sp. NML98-0116]